MEGGGSLSSILSSDGTDSVGFLPSNTGSVGFLPSNGGSSSVRSNDRAYRYDETLSDEATSSVLTSLEAAEEAYSRTHYQGKSGNWSPLILFLVSLKAFYKYGEWKVREDREGWKWETQNGQKSDELE